MGTENARRCWWYFFLVLKMQIFRFVPYLWATLQVRILMLRGYILQPILIPTFQVHVHLSSEGIGHFMIISSR